MTGLCRTIKSIRAKWRGDRGGGDTGDHCQAGRAGGMQQSVQCPREGARERDVSCKRGCESGCECEVERAACSDRVSVSVSVSVCGCEWACGSQMRSLEDGQIA